MFGMHMNSERTDWISQYGAVRKKKRGILGFIKAVLLGRSERNVRDVNDLDASDCIRRYNLVFGIDSDNPGAAMRRTRLPVSEPTPKPAVDFEASDSGNRPIVETEYYYAAPVASAVPTSSVAESVNMDPFPFEAMEEEQEEEDPYDLYIREKYAEEPVEVSEETVDEMSLIEETPAVEETVTETVQEMPVEQAVEEVPDYFMDLEMDSAEFSDVRAEEIDGYQYSTETVQTSIETFDEPDAPVSAEPILVRQDLLDIQFEEEPAEDVASEIAEAAAEAEALRTYVESVPSEDNVEASGTAQLIEAPAEYAALSAPADVPALGAPAEEPVIAIEASEDVPLLAQSEPVAAVCAPAEVVSLPAPAEEPAVETPAEVTEEDIEAYIYGMQESAPVAEPAEMPAEDIPVGIDMFDDFMELQDAVETEAPAAIPVVEETVEETPVVEEAVEEPVIEPVAEAPVIEEAPVAEESVEVYPLEELFSIADVPVQEPVTESVTEAPVVEEAPVEEEPVEEMSLEELFEMSEEPVAEIPAVEEIPVETIPEATVEEAPVIEAPAEFVFEAPIVETPVVNEMSADEFAVPDRKSVV